VADDVNFTCGAGTWFGVVDPKGNLRICNQAGANIGNILDNGLEELWNRRTHYLQNFRSLEWLEEPCKSCPMAVECMGGCKIDADCNGERVAHIDYYLRSMALKPDFKQMASLKRLLYKREEAKAGQKPVPKDYHINGHMRLVENKGGTYLLNQEIGVVKIGEDIASIVRKATLEGSLPEGLSDPELNLLHELGVILYKNSGKPHGAMHDRVKATPG
jgi:radical SAM protein with 4Fe4S-binding SPASM domain